MTSRLATLAVVSVAAGACVPEAAPTGAQVLLPADVEFSWNDAYNQEDDGRAAILPLDVMVYDVATQEALPGVDVELASDQAMFVPSEVVQSGDPDCTGCVWDAYRDEWVDLDPASVDEPLVVQTDAYGLARVYALVDAVSIAKGRYEPVTVRVGAGQRFETMQLVPR